MAKEVPYFKFFVGEWANGDITCELRGSGYIY